MWTKRYLILTNITVRADKPIQNTSSLLSADLVMQKLCPKYHLNSKILYGIFDSCYLRRENFRDLLNCALFFPFFSPFTPQPKYIVSRDPPASAPFPGSSPMPQTSWLSLCFEVYYCLFLHTLRKWYMTILCRILYSILNQMSFIISLGWEHLKI